MSKTYKDEPYWVRIKNTKKYNTYEEHCHRYFGVERMHSKFKTVRKGEPYVELITTWKPVFASEYHKVNTEELVLFLSFGGSSTLHYIKEEQYVYRQPTESMITDTFKVKGADGCTIDEDAPRQRWRFIEHPCKRYIVNWQLGKRETYSNRPDKWSANYHHAVRRARQTLEAVEMVKLYNSGEDLEDYDYEPLYQRTHEGWWD